MESMSPSGSSTHIDPAAIAVHLQVDATRRGLKETTGSYWSLFIRAGSAYLLALVIMHVLIPGMKREFGG
jgi:hypothetical protein